MRLLIVRKRPRLADRIREILAENGGRYEGLFDLALACETGAAMLRYQLRRMSVGGQVRIRPSAGGRGHKTTVELIR